jgi:predicted dehydrogenase
LDGRFAVAHIADGGSGKARGLAEGLGARWSSGEAELLADPDVDVVAVCTPPSEHERQIHAAIAAGKRAIFCEKPLATTRDAVRDVVAACEDAGVALMVGTNHAYDPGWLQARELLGSPKESGQLHEPVQSIAITLALPPNRRYHEVVTEGGPFQAPPRERPDISKPAVAAHIVKQLITGLAVHDLPSVRHFAPVFESVEYARFIPPVGYAVGYRASGVMVQLALVMLPEGPDALWRLTLSTPVRSVDLEYPPAFVHAGGGVMTTRHVDGSTTTYRPSNQDGYKAEWLHFAKIIMGAARVDYGRILGDALYPLELAEAVFAAMTEGGRR